MTSRLLRTKKINQYQRDRPKEILLKEVQRESKQTTQLLNKTARSSDAVTQFAAGRSVER